MQMRQLILTAAFDRGPQAYISATPEERSLWDRSVLGEQDCRIYKGRTAFITSGSIMATRIIDDARTVYNIRCCLGTAVNSPCLYRRDALCDNFIPQLSYTLKARLQASHPSSLASYKTLRRLSDVFGVNLAHLGSWFSSQRTLMVAS